MFHRVPDRRPSSPEVKVRGTNEVQEVGRWLLGPTIRPERTVQSFGEVREMSCVAERFAHLGSRDCPAQLSGIPNEGVSKLSFTSARQSTGEAASETDRLSLAK